MRAFLDKGRLNAMLSKIAVRDTFNDRAAIIGAAWCAASMIQPLI